MYRCTVKLSDGDIYEFMCLDIHSFCIQVWKYFKEYENMEIKLVQEKT